VIIGWAVQDLLYAVVLYLCILAFGATVNLWTVVVVELAVSTLASAVPIPGGSAAVGSVGTAGALVAVGVSKDVAVAAALTNQVVSSFLPAVPGWVAFQDLVRRDDL
jgi:uncharacterized protein (TIRG00374 family)